MIVYRLEMDSIACTLYSNPFQRRSDKINMGNSNKADRQWTSLNLGAKNQTHLKVTRQTQESFTSNFKKAMLTLNEYLEIQLLLLFFLQTSYSPIYHSHHRQYPILIFVFYFSH